MDLRTYLTAVRKGWWIVAVLTVLGAVLGYGYAARQIPVYAAHVSFYVSTPSASQDNIFSNGQFAEDRATSYAELLSSDKLAAQVVAETPELGLTAGQVAGTISAAADLNTVIVKATIKDTSPSQALAIATAVGNEFPKMIDSLDNTGASDSVTLTVVSGPSVSSAPVSPRKAVDAAIGLALGFLLGLLIAVLREALNTSVRDVETAAEITGAPILANVPLDRDAKRSPLVVGADTRSARAEALRQLRTNLEFIDAARPAKVITVTSSIVSEGKSATTANLAVVLAEAGRRVLVVEADLRRPHVSEYFGFERAIGLSNVLAGQVEADAAIQSWDPGRIDVLASGTLPPNPSELLGSPAMARLLTGLRERYDVVLLDTPPLLPVTDAAVLAVVSDGVIIVVRHGKTKRSQLATATKLLSSVGAHVIGAVLNMKPAGRLASTKYGYYYEDKPASSIETVPVAEVAGGMVVVMDAEVVDVLPADEPAEPEVDEAPEPEVDEAPEPEVDVEPEPEPEVDVDPGPEVDVEDPIEERVPEPAMASLAASEVTMVSQRRTRVRVRNQINRGVS